MKLFHWKVQTLHEAGGKGLAQKQALTVHASGELRLRFYELEMGI